MSLEQQLERFNTNFEKWLNTLGEKTGTTKTETVAETTGKKKAKGSKTPDIAAVKAVASAMIKATDKPTVIKLIKKIAKVGSTSEMDEEHYAAFITAATAAIKASEEAKAEEEDEEEEEDEDEDD